MKRRTVILSPEASADLYGIEEYISSAGSPVNALRFVERIAQYCTTLEYASERGSRRDDIRPGLRVVGFERRVSIAFEVTDEHVIVIRIFYGGADWERAF